MIFIFVLLVLILLIINGSGCLFKNKYEYLVRELPFLDPTKFIFTNSKHLIKADIQIDDRLNNLDNDVGIHILFSSYHNLNDKLPENVIRAGTHWSNAWKDIENILINR